MTTSVIYDNAQRGLNMAVGPSRTVGGVSIATIYGNLSTLFDTGVTQVQSTNNSASTTNPTATFTNTPTNGNVMIAILIRGSDNQASTGPSGWAQLDAAGTAGTRRLEFWWKRAGASEAKQHTWTNATANLWEVTLLEFGGWATKADPVKINACQNIATNTSYTHGDIGLLCGVQAVVTSGGSAGTFTDTGTNCESVTNIAVTTTTRFRTFIADAWTNRGDQTIQSSWTTSRPFTVGSVGWMNGDEITPGAIGYGVGNDSTANGTSPNYAAQLGYTYDTSSIPSANTVTSVTATYTSGPSASTWPSTATVDVYSLAGASISASNANGPAVWKTPTQLSALTRCATRAAGSAWAASTAYNWTSDAAFPGQIVKAGTTSLLLATSDQVSGTTRASDQYAQFVVGPAGSYLTIVHNLQAARTVAATTSLAPTIANTKGVARSLAASLTATPAISRVVATARTVAASVTTTPTITRLVAAYRTLAITVAGTPTVSPRLDASRTVASSITTTPTVNRAVAAVRTITATLDLTPVVDRALGVSRTLIATISASPTVTRTIGFYRTITSTLDLIGGAVATFIPFVPALTHKVSIRVRQTVSLVVPDRIRLTVRSRLRLPEE